MTKKLYYLQTLILMGGVLFSWSTLIEQFKTFYGLYGTLTRFSGCVIPNPLATPCFYGALAFLAAFFWSLALINSPRYGGQKWLRNFLLFGVLFALSVLSYEAVQYYHLLGGPQITCSPGTPPLKTPCFYGALFFSAAFAVSVFITKRLRKELSVSGK